MIGQYRLLSPIRNTPTVPKNAPKTSRLKLRTIKVRTEEDVALIQGENLEKHPIKNANQFKAKYAPKRDVPYVMHHNHMHQPTST